MHFAHDTAEALQFVAELCNTAADCTSSGRDELDSTEELVTLLDRNVYSGRRDLDARELREVHAARTELRRIWTLERDELAEAINVILAAGRATPQLRRHDGLDWHIHATEPDAPLATRIQVEAAIALSDVVRADETARLRECEAETCNGIMLDLSRNGSKRFCSVRCGNRVNVTAYRERRAASAPASP